LAGFDLTTLGGTSGNRRIVEDQLSRNGLAARGRFVVESTPTAIAMASAGVGAAILPAAMMARHLDPSVREIPLVDPIVHRSISLIRRKGETLPPAAEALHALLIEELTALQ